jgi:hypothetical protein
MKKVALTLLVGLAISATANAAIINFDIQGKAGTGLLAANENGVILGNPGSGGEVGAGITFDDVSLVLDINIGWGSGNGFTDLTGNSSGHHIHGPTVSNAPAAFNENASIIIFLDSPPLNVGFNPSATNGGYDGPVTLTAAQAAQLMAGRFYLNVHTGTNGGGEIRGNMVPVPEPASFVLFGLAAVGVLARRKFRRR